VLKNLWGPTTCLEVVGKRRNKGKFSTKNQEDVANGWAPKCLIGTPGAMKNKLLDQKKKRDSSHFNKT